MNDILFHPVRGLDEKIKKAPINDGYIYFATDTGKIYTDKDGTRIPLGGAGATILYAFDSNIIDNMDDTYYLSMDCLEDPNAIPKESDLIINTDGKFYKISSVDFTNQRMLCRIIAVSGSGGGGGGGGDTPGPNDRKIILTAIVPPALSYLYQKPANIQFKADAELDASVIIRYEVSGRGEGQYFTYSDRVMSGAISTFDVGSVLFEGVNRVTVTAIGENSGTVTQSYSDRRCMIMSLLKSNESVTLKPIFFDPNIPGSGKATVDCIPVGPEGMTLNVFLDDQLYTTIDNINTTNKAISVEIISAVHGVHKVRLELSILFNGNTVCTDPLEYELAWIEKNNYNPVIWFGEYAKEITNYDNMTVAYMVYDPQTAATQTKVEIEFIKGIETILTVEEEHSYDGYILQNIPKYEEGNNTYTIKCRNTEREFSINVLPSSRDLSVLTASAKMLLSSEGRNNNESPSMREKWSYKLDGVEKFVKFNNFNWYNNGWLRDSDGKNYLKISNGASIEVPFQRTVFNYNSDYTIEIRFKVRTVRDYSTLITNTTQYYTTKGRWVDEDKLDTLEPGEEIDVNDNGYQILQVVKNVSTNKGTCGSWLSGDVGLAIGTQEAYFNTGKALVNARYKEDKIITLSFVISKAQKLLHIYLNGILNSTIKIDSNFTIDNDALVFNSDYCDIDLYNIRIYAKELSFAEIVHNFIADKKDVDLYDQNHIYDFKPNIEEIKNVPFIKYEALLDYNATHPGKQTMPYMVIKTLDDDSHPIDGDKLPYFKGNKRKVSVKFVNPTLDEAYIQDKITQEYYDTHCPSFFATGAELNVQGTSSQGYPKRNYKCKFKGSTWNIYHKDPEKKDLSVPKTIKKWHMDNKFCETNKFTWKIDYMESSGSYNSGLADLLGFAYAKHPMEMYNFEGVDASKYRTTVYGFPVITFHEHSDGSFEYIGTYNFNLDKGSNEFYGFEDEAEQPYVTNSDGSHPKIADVAECWELRNNQGTWTSFKYPDNAKGLHFGAIGDKGLLDVINHFEYRYNNEEDKLDVAYDGKIDDPEYPFEDKDEINTYLRKKYHNLEVMFDWLVSTDRNEATNNPLPEPVTYGVMVKYQAKKDKDGVIHPIDAEGNYADDQPKKWVKASDQWRGAVYSRSEQVTFTNDTKEYRLQKFTHEFTEHFDKTYSLTYWIMTELLLLYDSRGKNCMLASWGPTADSKGNYIWFPIFYDMDTQLGINNSGIPTWDYDTDATMTKTFSTPSSVLWENIYDGFRDELESQYRSMRLGTDVVKDQINLNNVVGAYNRDPEVFKDSYAMKGVRPMVVFNAGEYVKYLGIMTNALGYYNTHGEKSKDDGAWLYIIQGDRELSRELFLTNRFNYFDSWFRAGSYDSVTSTGGKSIWMRINANNKDSTSDKYLYNTTVEGYTSTDVFPFKPYDADPKFTLQPFLKQFVTVGYDDLYTVPEKFLSEPITIDALENVTSAFQTSTQNGSQLVYIPGGDYLSSLGDLSSKYVDEFHFTNGKRCRELILGNDNPDYFNNLFKSSLELMDSYFDASGVENANRKALLEKIVLTGLHNYSENVDISGSDKMEEFRAVNTQIPGVTFAVGAPLHTVHLPRTTKMIEFIENNNLDKMITKSLCNSSNQVTPGHESEKGLYVAGVTDYDPLATEGTVTDVPLNSIKIIGNSLGYNSYIITNNISALKEKTESSELKIELQDVQWSPYILVDSRTTSPDPGKRYFLLTDHYTVEPYEDFSSWTYNVTNHRIYEYSDTLGAKVNTITDLSMLDRFIADYKKEKNHHFSSQSAEKHTIPLITGNIYVNNTSPISEVKIKNEYNSLEFFPDLHIIVKNVEKAKSAKFIDKSKTGQDAVLGIQKAHEDQVAWFNNPWDIGHLDTYIMPSKIHHDFIGWKMIEPQGRPEVITEDIWKGLAFEQYPGQDTFIFEAVYQIHSYDVTFYNGTKQIGETIKVPYGDHITQFPNEIPYKDDTDLPLEESYDFLGYGLNENVNELLPESYIVLKNVNLYALFERKNIKSIVHEDWFDYIHISYSDSSFLHTEDIVPFTIKGYAIQPKVKLSGKITLPSHYKGEPVISVTNFGVEAGETSGLVAENKITHIFVLPDNQLVKVDAWAFNGVSTLRYFDFENAHIRVIDGFAFNGCPLENENLGTELLFVGIDAFYRAFSSQLNTLYIPGSVIEISMDAFNMLRLASGATLVIGSEAKPSVVDLALPSVEGGNHSKFKMGPSNPLSRIDFYSARYDSASHVIGTTEKGIKITVTDCFNCFGSKEGTFNFVSKKI